jgi:hypothetical protein
MKIIQVIKLLPSSNSNVKTKKNARCTKALLSKQNLFIEKTKKFSNPSIVVWRMGI